MNGKILIFKEKNWALPFIMQYIIQFGRNINIKNAEAVMLRQKVEYIFSNQVN